MGHVNPREFTYGLSDIMRRLGQAGENGICRTERYWIRFADRLIETQGFPAPLPLLSGGTLATNVKPKSRWQVGAVDQWFDDRTPPDAAAREDLAARRTGEQAMDAAAEDLAARIAGRGWGGVVRQVA